MAHNAPRRNLARGTLDGVSLRPCARCGRHYGDEETCPHCGSTAWRAPGMPEALADPELRLAAPKYGGPPLRRFGRMAVVAGFFLALGWLARWLARRRSP